MKHEVKVLPKEEVLANRSNAYNFIDFDKIKQTAVEWLANEFYEKLEVKGDGALFNDLVNQAKEMEQNNTDNKVIHFAEWLTKKHTTVLITLYEQFEEEHYKDEVS